MFSVHFLRFMKLSSDVFTMTRYANGYGICTAQHSNANCKAERQKIYIKRTRAVFGNIFFGSLLSSSSMPFLLHKAKNVCKSVAREMVKTTQESPKPCDMIAIYAYWMPNICLKKDTIL